MSTLRYAFRPRATEGRWRRPTWLYETAGVWGQTWSQPDSIERETARPGLDPRCPAGGGG